MYSLKITKPFFSDHLVLVCNPDAKRLYDEILSNYNKGGGNKAVMAHRPCSQD
jgi:hypothetical protein